MPNINLGRVKGDKGETGEQGVGVTGLELKETLQSGNKVYSLVLSDGNKLDFEVPRGAIGETGATGDKGDKGDKGDTGTGIRGIELTRTETSGNKVYSHILTDNTKLEFEVPKGEVGATGAKGDKGDQGVQGVGIDTFRYKELANDGSFIYTITLTNGETYDLTSPIGPKGDKGDKGEPGKTIPLSLNSQDIIDNHRIFAKVLDDGADLNNITTPGFYRKDLDSKNIANSPISNQSYILIVTKIQPDSETYVTQIAQQYNTGILYIRYKVDNWSEWKRIATVDDLNDINAKLDTKSDKSDDWRLRYNEIGNTNTNTDLNTILSNGFYCSTSVKNKITNSPVGSSFELTVTGITIDGNLGPWNYKTQTIKSIENNSVYMRTTVATESSSHWGVWKKIWNEENFNPNDKLDTQGGTINGNLTVTGNENINGDLTGTSGKSISGFGKVYNPVWG